MEGSQILESSISLDQACLQIGNLCEERARLNEQIESQKTQLADNKAKIDLIDQLQIKSVNLENTNAHLIMQVGQKDEALKNQSVILQNFKTQMANQKKQPVESEQTLAAAGSNNLAELTAKCSSLERIQSLLESKGQLQQQNYERQGAILQAIREKLAAKTSDLEVKDNKIKELTDQMAALQAQNDTNLKLKDSEVADLTKSIELSADSLQKSQEARVADAESAKALVNDAVARTDLLETKFTTLMVQNGKLAESLKIKDEIIAADEKRRLQQQKEQEEQKLQQQQNSSDAAAGQTNHLQRAQIELNQIIANKLGEFRNLAATRSSQTNRETQMAIKIDDLTKQVSELAKTREQNDQLARENLLSNQQLELLKRQLQDGYKVNRELQTDYQNLKDDYRSLGHVKAREQKSESAFSFLNGEFVSQIHLLSGNQLSEDQVKMLFLGMHAKVKLFIERDTQRAYQDIDESKRRFKASLESLESQKRKERLTFARAINSLKRLYQSERSALHSDQSKIIEKLQNQIGMLAEIRESYDAKIDELKAHYITGQPDQANNSSSQKELNETLRSEIASLKENHTWIKKDNDFKTEQLNVFLADCGTKNQQLYELRKDQIAKETALVCKDEEIKALQEQLTQLKMNRDQVQWHLAQTKEQLEYTGADRSEVEAAFVKERVNEKLGELQQKLQVENAQLQIDLDDTKTRLLISENKTATIQKNYDNLVVQLQQSQQIKQKIEEDALKANSQLNQDGDVEMRGSELPADQMLDLETLKILIIDQEVILTTYTDQWELLYADLASCVKIMLHMERKNGDQESQSLRQDLEKANAQINQRQTQNKTLQDKITSIKDNMNQLQQMHSKELQKAQAQIKQMNQQQQQQQQQAKNQANSSAQAIRQVVSVKQTTEGQAASITEQQQSSTIQTSQQVSVQGNTGVKEQELQRENQLLKMEVEKLNKSIQGENKAPTPVMEILRHLMRSLDRAKRIIDHYEMQHQPSSGGV